MNGPIDPMAQFDADGYQIGGQAIEVRMAVGALQPHDGGEPDGRITGLVFHPDGSDVVLGSIEGTPARAWLDSPGGVAECEELLGVRVMTPEEYRDYCALHGEMYLRGTPTMSVLDARHMRSAGGGS